MDKIRILYGFNAPSFIRGVNDYLLSQGYEVECIVRMSKASIRDLLAADRDYDAAVLLEVFGNSSGDSIVRYEAEELSVLTDYTDINVIPVLNNNLKGSYYMQVLYDAGITSAVYQQNRGHGVSPQEIGRLVIKKRTRKDAREYYGIPKRIKGSNILESDVINQYVQYLTDRSAGGIASKFVEVCRKMSVRQTADFIRRMPEACRQELQQYEEFHIVLAILKKCGYDLKIKRAGTMHIGLVTPQAGMALPCGEVSLDAAVMEPEKGGWPGMQEEPLSRWESRDAFREDNEGDDDDVAEEPAGGRKNYAAEPEEEAEDTDSAPYGEPVSFAGFFDDADEEDAPAEPLFRAEDRRDAQGTPGQPEHNVVQKLLQEEPGEERAHGTMSGEPQEPRMKTKFKRERAEDADITGSFYVKPGEQRKKEPVIEAGKIEKEADIEGDYLPKLLKMQRPGMPAGKMPRESHRVRNALCFLAILCSVFFIIYYGGLYVKFFNFIYGV